MLKQNKKRKNKQQKQIFDDTSSIARKYATAHDAMAYAKQKEETKMFLRQAGENNSKNKQVEISERRGSATANLHCSIKTNKKNV